jgi:hypothetical protein
MKTKMLALILIAITLSGCQTAGWKEFRSAEGSFSVLMPGIPEEQAQTIDTLAGAVDAHLFVLAAEDAAYLVSYSDYPKIVVQQSNADDILDGVRDGEAANVRGALLSEQIISLDDYPGRELKIDTLDGKVTLRSRIFLVNNRLYQVVAVIPKDHPTSDKNIDKFLESFTLTD